MKAYQFFRLAAIIFVAFSFYSCKPALSEAEQKMVGLWHEERDISMKAKSGDGFGLLLKYTIDAGVKYNEDKTYSISGYFRTIEGGIVLDEYDNIDHVRCVCDSFPYVENGTWAVIGDTIKRYVEKRDLTQKHKTSLGDDFRLAELIELFESRTIAEYLNTFKKLDPDIAIIKATDSDSWSGVAINNADCKYKITKIDEYIPLKTGPLNETVTNLLYGE